MFPNMLKERSRRREDARANDVASIKARISEVCATGTSSVRGQIDHLRVQRDTGVLNHADYATRVASLLGSPDGAADHLAAMIRAA